jgi:thiamine biosynthesis lipoprotein
MKKIIPLFAFIILCGCSSSAKDESSVSSAERDVFAMDTYMNLKVYDGNCESALDEAENEISRLESLFSVTDENSDVWRINHSDGNYVDVDENTAELIEKALNIGNKTDGSLDITIYPVLREWGFTTGEYKIPDSDVLDSLLDNVDYKRVSVNGDSVCIPQNFQIDLGSAAKGYTSDRLIEIFKENDVTSAIVNLGGNVQTLGTKKDGSLWNVAVKNPFQPDSEMCIVSVENKAVITSGNYERYFTGEDGNNYWHIIDPYDGYPADNGLVSVTIIGESGVECDTLSTALFVAGLDKAAEYWRQEQNFDMILVTDDGRLFVTEGIEENVKVICSMTAEVIRDE